MEYSPAGSLPSLHNPWPVEDRPYNHQGFGSYSPANIGNKRGPSHAIEGIPQWALDDIQEDGRSSNNAKQYPASAEWNTLQSHNVHGFRHPLSPVSQVNATRNLFQAPRPINDVYQPDSAGGQMPMPLVEQLGKIEQRLMEQETVLNDLTQRQYGAMYQSEAAYQLPAQAQSVQYQTDESPKILGDCHTVRAPPGMNTSGGAEAFRTDVQMMTMSRDLVKIKTYNKLQRHQQDSDRLVRIEAQLSQASRPMDHSASYLEAAE